MSNPWHEWRSAVSGRRPRIAIILGSGLGPVADSCEERAEFAFADVPGWPAPTVAGHTGRLILGDLAGVPILLIQGRFHSYEGFSLDQITAPVRLAAELGVETLIATNAAGSIRPDLRPGSLMIVREHRYWRGPESIWRPKAFGSYSERLIDSLIVHGKESKVSERPGVYGNVTGPSYETRAEIWAMRECGIDAVGMSTAAEVDLAHTLGMECGAVSCITNWGTGLAPGGDSPHDHTEIVRAAASVADRMAGLLCRLLKGPPA